MALKIKHELVQECVAALTSKENISDVATLREVNSASKKNKQLNVKSYTLEELLALAYVSPSFAYIVFNDEEFIENIQNYLDDNFPRDRLWGYDSNANYSEYIQAIKYTYQHNLFISDLISMALKEPTSKTQDANILFQAHVVSINVPTTAATTSFRYLLVSRPRKLLESDLDTAAINRVRSISEDDEQINTSLTKATKNHMKKVPDTKAVKFFMNVANTAIVVSALHNNILTRLFKTAVAFVTRSRVTIKTMDDFVTPEMLVNRIDNDISNDLLDKNKENARNLIELFLKKGFWASKEYWRQATEKDWRTLVRVFNKADFRNDAAFNSLFDVAKSRYALAKNIPFEQTEEKLLSLVVPQLNAASAADPDVDPVDNVNADGIGERADPLGAVQAFEPLSHASATSDPLGAVQAFEPPSHASATSDPLGSNDTSDDTSDEEHDDGEEESVAVAPDVSSVSPLRTPVPKGGSESRPGSSRSAGALSLASSPSPASANLSASQRRTPVARGGSISDRSVYGEASSPAVQGPSSASSRRSSSDQRSGSQAYKREEGVGSAPGYQRERSSLRVQTLSASLRSRFSPVVRPVLVRSPRIQAPPAAAHLSPLLQQVPPPVDEFAVGLESSPSVTVPPTQQQVPPAAEDEFVVGLEAPPSVTVPPTQQQVPPAAEDEFAVGVDTAPAAISQIQQHIPPAAEDEFAVGVDTAPAAVSRIQQHIPPAVEDEFAVGVDAAPAAVSQIQQHIPLAAEDEFAVGVDAAPAAVSQIQQHIPPAAEDEFAVGVNTAATGVATNPVLPVVVPEEDDPQEEVHITPKEYIETYKNALLNNAMDLQTFMAQVQQGKIDPDFAPQIIAEYQKAYIEKYKNALLSNALDLQTFSLQVQQGKIDPNLAPYIIAEYKVEMYKNALLNNQMDMHTFDAHIQQGLIDPNLAGRIITEFEEEFCVRKYLNDLLTGVVSLTDFRAAVTQGALPPTAAVKADLRYQHITSKGMHQPTAPVSPYVQGEELFSIRLQQFRLSANLPPDSPMTASLKRRSGLQAMRQEGELTDEQKRALGVEVKAQDPVPAPDSPFSIGVS